MPIEHKFTEMSGNGIGGNGFSGNGIGGNGENHITESAESFLKALEESFLNDI